MGGALKVRREEAMAKIAQWEEQEQRRAAAAARYRPLFSALTRLRRRSDALALPRTGRVLRLRNANLERIRGWQREVFEKDDAEIVGGMLLGMRIERRDG